MARPFLVPRRDPPAVGAPVAPPFLPREDEVFASYAGSLSCRECHLEAYELWHDSHHRLAERPPDVLMEGPAFSPARTFRHGSQETAVRRGGTHYEVVAQGLGERLTTQQVERVIGHYPLRQFLAPAPGGRWQTLEAAYDPLTNEWFNVYGEEDRQPGEWGHWTGRGMNWNSMCAGCHNTRVRKNYDEAADAYRTAMAEPTVGCEACHGPLQSHVAWQQAYGKSGAKDPTVPPLPRPRMMETCAFCHARRSDLTGDFKPGDLFLDHCDLVVVDETDVYYPDGQVRDENFEYAAFLGSKMHSRGVTCLDCHQPHSMKTLLPGNWLCLRCHTGNYPDAPAIEPVTHSQHRVFGFDTNGVPLDFDLTQYRPREIKETGGECVNCHMPQTPYMQRHWRHDHGFTIPDPLLTREHGIPNACNRCHQDKTVDWSIEAVEKWYGPRMERPTRARTRWLAKARAGDPSARGALLGYLGGDEAPYWKAAVAELLEAWAHDAEVQRSLLAALSHSNALVRTKAIRSLAASGSRSDATVAAALTRALQDPVRAVRLSAAWALRGAPIFVEPAATELEHFLSLNADQPTGQAQRGVLELARARPAAALFHLSKAVDWDPNSPAFRHDLAVVLSSLERPHEAVPHLEAACRLAPRDAEFRYRLGLGYHEAGDLDRAAAALEEAVRLDPQHSRACYNLGLARHAQGRHADALGALQRAESLAPTDPRAPYARATILAQLGRRDEARRAAAQALHLAPEFAEARQLLQWLDRDPR